MARMSRSIFNPSSSHSASQQHFREFRCQYPRACSRQQLESGILPAYPEDFEAYRLCREWEEAHDQYDHLQQEAPLVDLSEGDDPDLTPTDGLTLLTLSPTFHMNGCWRQTSACHRYEDTPRDSRLQQSFSNACDAVLPMLTPRDCAILHLYAEGHGPHDIQQMLALKLTEQRVGQIIHSIRKAAHVQRAQQRADQHCKA